MLNKCRRGQWRIDDIDWKRPTRELSAHEEMQAVQTFTDMAEIERIAGGMFALQRDRVDDPRLRAIFASFVRDEHRHAQVATRLARHYNVLHYREYRPNPAIERFGPRLLRACREVSPEVANFYITTGELLLDVALLRSLDDFVADPTSHEAMALINRDESRHVAMDFYMIERYCDAAAKGELPRRSTQQWLRATWAMGSMMAHARPFINNVLIAPMDTYDPDGRRLREAFKRMQLVGRRPEVASRPFVRFIRTMQQLVSSPLGARRATLQE